MKTVSPKIILTIAGAFLFNLLFWQEKMAVNLLLFDLFIVCAILKLYPGVLLKSSARWILSAHVIGIVMVVVYNTLLSKITAVLTLFFFAAFAEHFHRSILFAAGTLLYQAGFMLPAFASLIRAGKPRKTGGHRRMKVLRLLLFPIVLLFFFFVVYIAGNRAFASISLNVFTALENYFNQFFIKISWERFFFILLGGYLTGVLIIQNHKVNFADKELSLSDRLIRTRDHKQGSDISLFNEVIVMFMGNFSRGMLALKNKNQVGLISFVLLNGLLLLINITDLLYIWTGNEYGKDKPLSDLLHEGTGLLIFSIFLAIIVVLFFFNGNLNFYKKNRQLKIAAYIWIIQNAFLVASVAIRDYYYISHLGLAYKRIGVLFFLAVVLAGLASVFLKIYKQKSNYFLFRLNGNFLLIMLVLASLVNWDVVIARYNIARIDKIEPDVKFLMRLSDQTLPVIRQNLGVLSVKCELQNFAFLSQSGADFMTLEEYLAERERRFISEQKSHTWLSWNLADAKVISAISGSTTVTSQTSAAAN